MAKVLLAGESWISATTEYKGFDQFTSTKIEIGCERFLEALSGAGHDVCHLRAHDVPELFPWTMEELDRYDVVILSDIGSNSLLLPVPVFVQGKQAVNRLDLLGEWVRGGHGLFMAGGYLSFAGFEGKAHYHGTTVERVLPVQIAPYDDRVETPQGVQARLVNDHPVIEGLRELCVDNTLPPILGYQKLLADAGSDVLLQVDDDPMLVVGTYGSGRTAAYASDISPHWAPESFMDWEGYGRLFGNLVAWLAKER